MSERIASLYAEIGADTSGLQQGLQAAKAGLTQAQQQMTATGAAAGKFSSFTQTAALAMVGLNSAVMLGRQGLQVLGSMYEATAGRAAAYNKDIRETSINLGLTTEETSRIAQAMDDYGISISSVTTALEMMTKRGMQPSIENLAQLADQFVSIKDPVERAALMTEKLGRNWTTLTPMLSQGGAKFREVAAGVEQNLLVTEEAAAASEQYRLAVDALSDSFEGLKIQIGNGVIPALTNFIRFLSDADFKDAAGKFSALGKELTQAGGSYGKYVQGALAAAEADHYVVKANGDLVQVIKGRGGIVERVIQQNYLLTESEYLAARATDDRAEATRQHNAIVAEGYSRLASQYTLSQSTLRMMGEQSFAERARAFSIEETDRKMTELNLFMSGPVKKENENYRKSLQQLQRELSETGAKIAKLKQQPWNKKELQETQAQYDGIKTQIVEVEQQHNKSSKQILFDLTQQRLAQDGVIDKDDLDLLMGMGEQWGLIDDETKQLYNNLKFPVDSFQAGELSASKTLEILERMAETDWVVSIEFQTNMPAGMGGPLPVSYSGSTAAKIGGANGGGKQEQKAVGGPVMGGSTYLVGENGPELFVPPQNGAIVPNNQITSGGGVTQNITVNLSLPQNGYSAQQLIRELERLGVR